MDLLSTSIPYLQSQEKFCVFHNNVTLREKSKNCCFGEGGVGQVFRGTFGKSLCLAQEKTQVMLHL